MRSLAARLLCGVRSSNRKKSWRPQEAPAFRAKRPVYWIEAIAAFKVALGSMAVLALWLSGL